jgi:hypothetical protein
MNNLRLFAIADINKRENREMGSKRDNLSVKLANRKLD